MTTERLDDFDDVSSWLPVASGEASLTLAATSFAGVRGLTLDFDFKGGGGFVVARKVIARSMPPVFTLSFRVRGSAPANRLEVKLVDSSGANVWWYRREGFAPPGDWTPIVIRSRDLEFAWGPRGGGVPADLSAIEIAAVAPPGGKGTLSIADLELEDRSAWPQPTASASREMTGHAASATVDGVTSSSWRSGPTSSAERLDLDFGVVREHGGFIVEWEQGKQAADFDVLTSLDGKEWALVRSVRNASAERSYVFSQSGGDARYLRLDLHRAAGGEGFGVRGIEIAPYDMARSREKFFAGVAAHEPRGRYPRWLYGEQSYWTPLSAADGGRRALVNEDSLIEVGRAGFTLEPVLALCDRLVTWADYEKRTAVRLTDGWLPLPVIDHAGSDDVPSLTVRPTVTRRDGHAAIVARYEIDNTTGRRLGGAFHVAIRPFQVTPPWQSFRGMGGIARIDSIELADGIVWVNGERAVLPVTAPSRFAAAAFDDGSILEHIARGELPSATRVADGFGCASATMGYDFELDPGEKLDVAIVVPLARHGGAPRDVLERLRTGCASASALRAAHTEWAERCASVGLDLGCADPKVAATVKTAACHILTNRYGAALQPGPRRYTRSWVRDAATMSAALLRMGRRDEVRDFLRWYAPYQAADGNVPCCVDELGADWLVEHDSHGQLAFIAMEHHRLGGDRELLAEWWPAVASAARYIEALCATRKTGEYASGDKRDRYGLLPESASHEGYLAQPVHSYWDDFWAVRGLGDASAIAGALGKHEECSRLATLRDELASALYDSIRSVIAKKRLAYVPGSVEWADFDPTATANAFQISDAAERLPPTELAAMYDEYMKGFRRRRDGEAAWVNYTAYEIRIIGALVRLGRRDEAVELLDFYVRETRPHGWNQWPEITWRDPHAGAHVGDLPHSWIGAEYVLSMLSMLAYERVSDDALVLAAGIPESWLGTRDDASAWRAVSIRSLPTYYGALDYSLARESSRGLRFEISSDLVPPGGIVLRPPLPSRLLEAHVDGRAVAIKDGAEVRLKSAPAEVLLRF